MVCLHATLQLQLSVSVRMDSYIMHISMRQSAATSEIVKRCCVVVHAITVTDTFTFMFTFTFVLRAIEKILNKFECCELVMFQVSVTEISNVPFCSSVHVEPASVDDWEILVSTVITCSCNSYLPTNHAVVS